ncbi:MAG: SAM-dependent chlorinase/fluorinase [Deltaproteobacteria bacterium]|nr:SAM-dependent chlorinase/fluorinase [Deltaproteobacteria bacterium]
MMPLVAFTSDFGAASPYVAQVKGVLLSALNGVHIVDVTHAIRPYAIGDAEVVLRSVAFAMPKGAVHLVVIDPGVGTRRRAIAVQARGMSFVGPDNGVLGVALRAPGARAVLLDRPALFRAPVAPTFHGRDIFAPVAAELARGISLDEVGSPITDAVASTLPAARQRSREVTGETLAGDAFGNLTTNIPAHWVPASWRVYAGDQECVRVRTYGEATHDRLLALAGSDGYLEIAMREGSAAAACGVGAEVVCRAP